MLRGYTVSMRFVRMCVKQHLKSKALLAGIGYVLPAIKTVVIVLQIR
jgi:hypothetical protein